MKCSQLRSMVIGVLIIVSHLQLAVAYYDVPCDAVQVYNRSVICRCNATYCDTLIREQPADGEVITYTSSDSGLRFFKQSTRFEDFNPSREGIIFDLDPNTKYQTINGFGGAVTDAAGINWQNLSDPQLKQHLINSYCSDVGLQYNMFRVPIGGTDFSTTTYAYNEYPPNDKELSNFSLSYEDYAYKLPFIKACMEVAPEEINVVSSCWSPPTWMKKRPNFIGVNFLKPEYYQTYADYHVKFVDEYTKEGVPIWALTTTNEPMTNIAEFAPINSLGWTSKSMGIWVADYFGPTLRKHYPNIKLIGVDDQRPTIPIWLNAAAILKPEMIDYLDGIGVHIYLNMFDTPETISLSLKQYPKLFVLATEASFGKTSDSAVQWGLWDRAEYYAMDIIKDLNVDVIGWIDWNMILNSEGGPVWNSQPCDAAVIGMPEEGAFYKQPMFYAIGHFAKFLPRGSRRIELSASNTTVNLYSVAAFTPSNTIVVVFNNWETSEIEAILRLGDKQAKVILPPKSIVTSEFLYKL